MVRVVAPAHETEGPGQRRVRALIADDDADARFLLTAWLQRAGTYDVAEVAEDGLEAVEAAGRGRPELVILDLAMPRMDGLEAATAIRELLPDARIVIHSAFSAGRMAQKAIDAGADVYVEKSAGQGPLLAALEGLFHIRADTLPSPRSSPRDGRHGGTGMSREHLLLDALDSGVVFADEQGCVVSANFTATLLLGVPTSGIIGWRLADHLGSGQREDEPLSEGPQPDPLTAALISGRPQSGTVLRVARPDRSVVWVSVNVRPLFAGETARPSGAVVVLHDVSQERRLSRSLQDAERQLALLLEMVGSPAAVLHARTGDGGQVTDFRVDRANRAARSLTGWHAGDGSPSTADLSASDRLFPHLVEALDVGEVCVPHDPRASAADRAGDRAGDRAADALDVRLLRTAPDELVATWVLAQSRGSAEPTPAPGRAALPEAFQEATELLEAAVASSPVGAALFDRSGRLVIANPVADRLLGSTPLLGHGPATRRVRRADTGETLTDDLPVRRACQGEPFDDLELFVADGEGDESTFVKVSGRPVFGAGGQPGGAVVSVRDDSSAKRAEQALIATHKELERSNAELESFASIASHDLSQPLQAVSGFAQLLREGGPQGAHAGDYIDKIVTGCERMRILIGDLLTYSRLMTEARPSETVDLIGVVDDVVSIFRDRLAETGARVTADPLPTVEAERTQMTQLFQNLVGNALTYVAPGVIPEVHVSSARLDHEWLVVVADNGIGIRPEDRVRAFTMFQRLETSEAHSGTGIGLAVCAKIVDRHGGRIWIEDNSDGGSRFCLTLPEPLPEDVKQSETRLVTRSV